MIVVPAAEVTSMLHFGTAEAEQVHVLGTSLRTSHRDRLEKTFLYRRGLRVQESARVRARVDERSSAGGSHGAHVAWIDRADGYGLVSALQAVSTSSPPGAVISRCLPEHHAVFWDQDPELFGWTPER